MIFHSIWQYHISHHHDIYYDSGPPYYFTYYAYKSKLYFLRYAMMIFCSLVKIRTIQSWQLVEADLLQRITNFTLCNRPFAGSRFRLLMAGEVGKISMKPLKREIRQAGKTIKKMYPDGLTYLTARSEYIPIWGFNGTLFSLELTTYHL